MSWLILGQVRKGLLVNTGAWLCKSVLGKGMSWVWETGNRFPRIIGAFWFKVATCDSELASSHKHTKSTATYGIASSGKNLKTSWLIRFTSGLTFCLHLVDQRRPTMKQFGWAGTKFSCNFHTVWGL